MLMEIQLSPLYVAKLMSQPNHADALTHSNIWSTPMIGPKLYFKNVNLASHKVKHNHESHLMRRMDIYEKGGKNKILEHKSVFIR